MLTKITSIRTYSQREIQMSHSVTLTFVSQVMCLCTSCYYWQFGNRITQSLRPHCLLVGLGPNEVPSTKVINISLIHDLALSCNLHLTNVTLIHVFQSHSLEWRETVRQGMSSYIISLLYKYKYLSPITKSISASSI